MKSKNNTYRFKSVMLIDDNEIDNFINEKMIKSSNFSENVYIHSSAKSALEFFKSLSTIKEMPSELIPQYIFLDINMPILDGFQFLDEFKDISADLYPEIKIAMLTTSLNPIDLENSKQYKNVVGFIYKPLIKDELDKLT